MKNIKKMTFFEFKMVYSLVYFIITCTATHQLKCICKKDTFGIIPFYRT